MSEEKRLANELNKMMNEDRIPLSISEDIHEISASLINGEMKLSELEGKDKFIEDTVQEALTRMNK